MGDTFACWTHTNRGSWARALPPLGQAASEFTPLLIHHLKRRTRVATLFPNAASLLRLVSAVVIEIPGEWETGRIYLGMDA